MQAQALVLAPGFDDPVHESQSVFRAAMTALSRPGMIVPLHVDLLPPTMLTPTAAALALTLVDFETKLYLGAGLDDADDVQRYLSFHTGATMTAAPGHADFALVADIEALPPLGVFAQGNLEYPDRSTTVIVQVQGFDHSLHFEGPGIDGRIAFGISGAPARLAVDLEDNRARFPLGVDLVFAAPHAIAALPRSSRLVKV